MPGTDTIFQRDPPLAVLTLNRPEALNAMTWAMYQALADACDRVDRDDDVRVFVLRGAGGRAFAAGSDISQFQRFQSAEDGVAYERRISEVVDRLAAVTRPTIAQIAGVAAGAGCVMAAACDLRVATPESTFGVPIARTLGNCLSEASLVRLIDLIGPGHVKDMLFTGRLFSAEEAQAAGLLTRIVPAGRIETEVQALALAIASNAPLTIRATKMMMSRLAGGRGADIRDLLELCYGSEDFREGVSAFLAKRPPRWKGR
ncbi:MAG: enoyl-CoA hydratase [Acidobacteria bacterium RIFCSPLOWO2_12_FULL_67_14]|nr:MAG: enoyl-CoA hydratase [Acidobacteria bacterium RIFCSPLOWO2_02_FULL_67_21]OFW37301.1 MAG: enoyl-CoA hydratase [Acidobacteria bacterium RIFCSPLOWO2_12_FULL_67_14]